MDDKTTSTPQRLGDLLVARGEISSEQLDDALAQQKRHHAPLGLILTTLNRLNPFRLHQTLAVQSSLPFINLEEEPADEGLSDYHELDYYLSHRCLPWRIQNGTMVIACCEVTPKLRHWAEQFYHREVQFVICTPRDIITSIERLFMLEIDTATRTRLLNETPHLSAFRTLHPKQTLSLLALKLALTGCFIIAPFDTLLTLLLLANFFYIATIGMKVLLYRAAKQHSKAATLIEHNDSALPIYTLLVPLYKEAVAIPRLLNALRALDYPKTKLDIKLIVESDDAETLDAIKAAQPESCFEIMRVPYSLPRTKPKACNYALTFARGDYVTIYDAEDQPEPTQLRKAVATFNSLPSDVICLQARLNYYNWNENWISRFFALEYSILFDFMLPGLQALGIPIPLGGTSNHINLKRLREIGEWDPYNVTEDADLGIRLAMRGYRTCTLDSITLEESPLTLRAWVRQRSRWIKGYMQTWLVYMRHPKTLYRTLKPKGFWGFQLFVGGPCLVFLSAPFLWGASLLWAMHIIQPTVTMPHWMLSICILVLLVGAICHIWLALAAIRHWRFASMLIPALFFPFYWFLHSIASLRALWQLIFRPHFWEKTTHGLSKQLPNT